MLKVSVKDYNAQNHKLHYTKTQAFLLQASLSKHYHVTIVHIVLEMLEIILICTIQRADCLFTVVQTIFYYSGTYFPTHFSLPCNILLLSSYIATLVPNVRIDSRLVVEGRNARLHEFLCLARESEKLRERRPRLRPTMAPRAASGQPPLSARLFSSAWSARLRL